MLNNLRNSVIDIVETIEGSEISDLNREWKWKGYNEGIRFAYLRVNESLRQLAVHLKDLGLKNGHPNSMSQNIFSQHHAAYFDLRAILLGCDEELVDLPPSKGEWTVRQAFQHIVEGEWAFLMAIETGLDRVKNQVEQEKFSQEDWDEHFVERGGITDKLFKKPLPELLIFYDDLHETVLGLLNKISDEELEWKIVFWEEEFFTIRFRLHRFESHLRQHNIQIEETLITIGHQFSEARKLCRQIYNSLAEVETALFGIAKLGNDLIQETTILVDNLNKEIKEILT